MNKEGAFTLIEVVVSLGIFSLLCMAFLSTLDLSLSSYDLSKDRYKNTVEAEDALQRVKKAMKEYKAEELTPEIISSIIDDNSDPKGSYRIMVRETSSDGLYEGEIIFGEGQYERLWTQIHVP